MKRTLLFFTVIARATASGWAQEESRHEVTIQGSGLFGKTTSGSGVQNKATTAVA